MILFYFILLTAINLIITNEIDYSNCECGKLRVKPQLNEINYIEEKPGILRFIGVFYNRLEFIGRKRSISKLMLSEDSNKSKEHIFYYYISTVVLLNNQYALTTAQSVEKHLKFGNAEVHEHYVAFGADHDLQKITRNDGFNKALDSYYVHPLYDSIRLEKNMALLKLKDPFTMGPIYNIFAGCLFNLQNVGFGEGEGELFTAGYGYEKWQNHPAVNSFKLIKVQIVEDKGCEESGKICVMNDVVGTCNTDEGSPLLLNDGTTLRIIGINDWSVNCDKGNIIEFTPVINDEFLSKEEHDLNEICEIPNLVKNRRKYCKCKKLETISSRVIDGVNVIEGDFEFSAAFYQITNFIPQYRLAQYRIDAPTKYKYFCTGALINSKFILTAAHCVEKLKPVLENNRDYFNLKYRVAVGGEKLEELIELQYNIREIQDIILYPLYNKRNLANDIALVEVSREFDIGAKTNIFPACLLELPLSFLNDFKNANLYIAGYGKITELIKERSNEVIADTNNLKMIKQHKVECEADVFFNNRLCYKNDGETDQTTCFGDSGGGVYWFDTDSNKLNLVAIHSGSQIDYNETYASYCSPRKQNFGTLVYPYLNWLQRYIKFDFCSHYN